MYTRTPRLSDCRPRLALLRDVSVGTGRAEAEVSFFLSRAHARAQTSENGFSVNPYVPLLGCTHMVHRYTRTPLYNIRSGVGSLCESFTHFRYKWLIY